jgi:hypothetical protein
MPIDPLRLAGNVEGHLGWLAVAALVHPAILLRDRRRRMHVSIAATVVLVTLTGALGVLLYPYYTGRLKQRIFIEAPTIGYLFERKEHLAFGAILLTWAGALGYLASFRAQDAVRDPLRRFAHWAYVLAAALAAATATLGTIVAAYKSF